MATKKETQAAIDRATAAITNSTSVEASATTLIAELIQIGRDNANDPAALLAALDAFEARTSDLATAVAANTPADPNAPTSGDTGNVSTGDTGGMG